MTKKGVYINPSTSRRYKLPVVTRYWWVRQPSYQLSGRKEVQHGRTPGTELDT